jgi:hypothetical protein
MGQLIVAAQAAREKQIELAQLVWIAGFAPHELPTRAESTKPNVYSGKDAARILEKQFFPLLNRNKPNG